MTGLLFAGVVLIAAGTWVVRRMRARAARARARSGPGSSLEQAVVIRSFDAIDRTVAARLCHCGARLHVTGEGTREAGERRYRVTRLTCDECEDETVLYFDVSTVLH